jgi:bacteriocin-like protein
MNELTTMTELTDKELDAVVGGAFLNGPLAQINFNVQTPVAVNVGSGSAFARARSGLFNGSILGL